MVKLTSREYDSYYMNIEDFPTKREVNRSRNQEAERVLRPLLKTGDILRATRAECFAHEATFRFDHWEGVWIVSKSGISIAPSSVYSVNGKIFRFTTLFIGPVRADPPQKFPFNPPVTAIDADDDVEFPF